MSNSEHSEAMGADMGAVLDLWSTSTQVDGPVDLEDVASDSAPAVEVDAPQNEVPRRVGFVPTLPLTPTYPHRVPIVVNDGDALTAALMAMEHARQAFMVRPQNVLEPLTNLEDLGTWVRSSDLKQRVLQLDDKAMARSAVLRLPTALLLQVETMAGADCVESWEKLKGALNQLTSGAHPLIAAGMEYLKESERCRDQDLSLEAAFEAGKGRVQTYLKEMKKEHPVLFTDEVLEQLGDFLLVPFIVTMIPEKLVPTMNLDKPFSRKNAALELMRNARRFTHFLPKKRQAPMTQKERVLATYRSDIPKPPQKCYACGEVGHFAAKCPSKKKKKCKSNEVSSSNDTSQSRPRKRTRSPSKQFEVEASPKGKNRRIHEVVRVKLCVNQKTVLAIVDTAATISLVDVAFVNKVGWAHRVKGEGCRMTGSVQGVSDRTLGVLEASISPGERHGLACKPPVPCLPFERR